MPVKRDEEIAHAAFGAKLGHVHIDRTSAGFSLVMTEGEGSVSMCT